jgi:HD-GYP domain-containing protein (c-di-GMP phosphodiesterase class II)
MTEEAQNRVRIISEKHHWLNSKSEEVPLLTDNEIYNLTIPKGTLTKEEREIINRHIDTTIAMLKALPYPKNLRRVPEYAGGHHERMDGKGYPNGLTRDQLSIPARVMGIADIFEALTAQDRPYKKPMPLSVALTILGKMKLDNHIDPDLFDVFIHEKVYLKYAYRYLSPEQIDMDEESVKTIPGYNPLSEEEVN